MTFSKTKASVGVTMQASIHPIQSEHAKVGSCDSESESEFPFTNRTGGAASSCNSLSRKAGAGAAPAPESALGDAHSLQSGAAVAPSRLYGAAVCAMECSASLRRRARARTACLVLPPSPSSDTTRSEAHRRRVRTLHRGAGDYFRRAAGKV